MMSNMTLDEAEKIFSVWSKWYWPCHFILRTVFMGTIPESYLPYPQHVLEEALQIVAKRYYDSGDIETAEIINHSMCFCLPYAKDKEAYEQATKNFSNPEIIEVLKYSIDSFKKDYEKYLEQIDSEKQLKENITKTVDRSASKLRLILSPFFKEKG